MITLQAACRILADQCEITRREAEQIASGKTDDVADVVSLLYSVADLETAAQQVRWPARQRCKGGK